ncbi:polyphenol oxidase family protein [Oryzobacter terrae]|uniref:polyphenol oxidase family protein n=1 Tax=Oryzobacter terrae TaxID=1620385 RepID=UPI00366D4681
MFAWQETRSGVLRAVTDRSAGVSTGRWSGLNLGAHVEDDPAAVAENRRLLGERVGRRVVYMDQCHGAEVVVLDDVPDVPPRCDGVVTRSSELALAVLVADCVPVLLSGTGGVVAAVHAGRPGMVAGVVPRTLEVMAELDAGEVDAVVGPSVCGRCYEVPVEMRSAAAKVEPVSATVSWTGTPAVDVAAGVVAQLHAAGVPVRWVPGCSRERDDLYSYRRDGTTGRFAGVVARVAS